MFIIHLHAYHMLPVPKFLGMYPQSLLTRNQETQTTINSNTLQKMHTTAWKLVNDFVSEVVPTWDVSAAKTAQGQG